MSETSILLGCCRVIAKHITPNLTITPSTSIQEEIATDSLAQLTLMVEIENYFHITFDEADSVGLRTVGDLVALIERRLPKR